MKFFGLHLLAIIVLGCNSNSDEKLSTTETIKTAEVVARQSDSSKDWEKSRIALPAVNFGISLKEYQAANRYIMQGFGANTYFVRPFFNSQSKLFKIELSGISRDASYSSIKLTDDLQNLVKFFENDNGTPKALLPTPKLTDIKNGEILWTHSWSNYSKRVKVGIAHGTDGETYEVVGWVYDEEMLKNKQHADSLLKHPDKKLVHKQKKPSKRGVNRKKPHRTNDS